MGIFSSIKNAIFGKDEDEKSQPPATSTAPPAKTLGGSPVEIDTSTTTVDVEQRLDKIEGADKLNWRTSIVDLLKLLSIDPSYENRKELATEMGRTDYSGSADDNIWLHKRVMQEIADHGGHVPAELLK
tara:strand:- start:1328 stop:1714 length:387 start_codon:yes stop_codon:yes gene_type:complete